MGAIAKFPLGDAMPRIRAWPHVGRAFVVAAALLVRVVAAVVVVVAAEFVGHATAVFALEVAGLAGRELAGGRLIGLERILINSILNN